MPSHYMVKCRCCDKIVTQCRCPDPNKRIEWTTCDNCRVTPGLDSVPASKKGVEMMCGNCKTSIEFIRDKTSECPKCGYNFRRA